MNQAKLKDIKSYELEEFLCLLQDVPLLFVGALQYQLEYPFSPFRPIIAFSFDIEKQLIFNRFKDLDSIITLGEDFFFQIPFEAPKSPIRGFVPEVILEYSDEKFKVVKGEKVLDRFLESASLKTQHQKSNNSSGQLEPRNISETKESYIQKINHIKNQITEGEFYEINFCVKHSLKGTLDNLLLQWYQWSKEYKMPFASFLRIGTKEIASLSPERFLKLQNGRLISQPIKGTAPRSSNPEVDKEIALALKNSEKERAENLMIVDLVRNDLSIFGNTGTTKVEELIKLYSFPTVHQLISTISCELPKEVSLGAVIENCFPMGSMTGAPKKRVLEEISLLEPYKRAEFSGTIGYWLGKEKHLDCNVLIRSFFQDKESNSSYFCAGSAITIDSNPEEEWLECDLKTLIWQKVLKEFLI